MLINLTSNHGHDMLMHGGALTDHKPHNGKIRLAMLETRYRIGILEVDPKDAGLEAIKENEDFNIIPVACQCAALADIKGWENYGEVFECSRMELSHILKRLDPVASSLIIEDYYTPDNLDGEGDIAADQKKDHYSETEVKAYTYIDQLTD